MSHDLIIIGAGWAGYNAYFEARKLGINAVIIEQGQLGGTCLNRGCIPTKSLIQSAKLYSQIKKSRNFGIEAQLPALNFALIQQRKNKVVNQLRQGMEFALKQAEIIRGKAVVKSAQEVEVDGKGIKAKNILIASGSSPRSLQGLDFSGKILSSDDILSLESLPQSLLIMGGGVIGCEFAALFAMLGAKVTISEKESRLLPLEDPDISTKLAAIFSKRGVNVLTGENALPPGRQFDQYEKVLVCIGRNPVSRGLGLEEAGIKTGKAGQIAVDKYLMSSLKGVYAAGDCCGGIMLAHFAAYQGRLAVRNLSGVDEPAVVEDSGVPSCIFTDPEISSVGMSLEAAQTAGIKTVVHKFDFLALGMAKVIDETEGFIKLVSENDTGRLIGASIIGPRATELIAVLTVAIKNNLTIRNIRETIFAHPTVSEIIKESVL